MIVVRSFAYFNNHCPTELKEETKKTIKIKENDESNEKKSTEWIKWWSFRMLHLIFWRWFTLLRHGDFSKKKKIGRIFSTIKEKQQLMFHLFSLSHFFFTNILLCSFSNNVRRFYQRVCESAHLTYCNAYHCRRRFGKCFVCRHVRFAFVFVSQNQSYICIHIRK